MTSINGGAEDFTDNNALIGKHMIHGVVKLRRTGAFFEEPNIKATNSIIILTRAAFNIMQIAAWHNDLS